MLTLENLSYEPTGLHDISFSVAAGKVVVLVGPNGAGKTTLLKLILGVCQPSLGTVTYEKPYLTGNIGFLIGHAAGYPELTVEENLHIAALLAGKYSAEHTKQAMDHWGLAAHSAKPWKQLSTGLQQRVALARVFQYNPRLILLDEPTNALDPAGILTVRRAVIERAKYGAGIIVCSHYLDEVARIADQIHVLHYGRLIGQLDPAAPDLERQFFQRIYNDDCSAEH